MAMVEVGSGAYYYYLNDRLGTPVLMVDATNTAVWEANVSPFGKATVNPNSTKENNFRFAGQYYDNETGLHYNYHRYYDPRTGRYLTPDPIGLAGGINLYAYVQNNPINAIDPFGLFDIALTPIAIDAAPGIAMLDSPFLPFADTFAAALIGLAYLHDTWPDQIPASLSENNRAGNDSCKTFSDEKQALIEMARQDRNRGGISTDDMNVYKELNKQLSDPFPSNQVRGPELHPNRNYNVLHGHVGPVNKIPIK
jgi:RHS repeat-associated protein